MVPTEAPPIARYHRIITALRACQRARAVAEAETELRLAVVHTARESGHGATDIADALGVTRQTVYRIAARGRHLDGPLFADLEDVAAADQARNAARRRLWAKAAEARRAGATIGDIAGVLGVAETTVQVRLAAARGASS